MMVSSFASAMPEDPVPDYEPTMSGSGYMVPMTTSYYGDDYAKILSGEYDYRGDGYGYPDEASLAEGLKQAIIAVKLHFDIDEDIYTRFESSYNPGNGYYYPESWYLYWYSNDYNAYINAHVTTGGILLNFYQNDSSKYDSYNSIRLAEISKAEAKNIAGGFLKNVLGGEFADFRLSYQSLYYPSDRYYLDYILTKNGYDHADYTVSVSIDKITGEIMSFSRSGHNFFYDLSKDILDYQDASSVISKQEALASYLDKVGVELVYSSYFNWQTRELTVHPVYRFKNNYGEYISAVDGSLVRVDYNIRPVAGPATGGEMNEEKELAADADDGAAVRFSEVELDAINKMGQYITKDEAIGAMIKAFGLDINPDEFNQWTRISVNYINQDQYIWNIELYKYIDYSHENYYASVDARTGDILSYNSYVYDYSNYYEYDEYGNIISYTYIYPEYIYNYNDAKDIVFAQIKALLPDGIDFDGEFELVENNYYSPIMPYVVDDMDEADYDMFYTQEDFKDSYYSFYLVRKANGLQFENNYISVGFNNERGVITNYSLEWYENAQFPSIDNIIDPAAALDSLADFAEYNIYYFSNGMTEEGRINVSLLYVFENTYVAVDPYTGKWISRWGFDEIEKYTASAMPDYQDLDGHWSKDIVTTLADNGIYVWGGEAFEPDKGITKGELLEYLRFYMNNYWSFSQVSSIFINPRGYYGYDDSDLNKVLTRQEAMKTICEVAGYGEIGKRYEIFVYPFGDVECDPEYKGYIAIAKIFGFIYGDGDGNFNAFKTLTRAEAAAIVWNIVMTLQGGQG
jgi:hypothetical protein